MEVPTSSMLSLHPQQCRVDDEAVKPLVDMFEDRQAFTIGDDEEESAKNFAATVATAEPFQCRFGVRVLLFLIIFLKEFFSSLCFRFG